MEGMMGLDPISVIMSIATNLATDILKHYAQYLDNTWVGKRLKEIGLIEETRDDHLRTIIEESLRLYLQTHSDYDLSGVESFFRDPVTIQQIGNYIFDQHPLDQLALEDALTRTIKKDPITMTLMKRHGALPERIIPDFLNCYRQVLNRYVDAPEKAILLAVLDATNTILTASHADAQQTQALINRTAHQQMQILQGTPISLAPGQLIGRYRIEKYLTKGTFGALYQAEHQDTGSLVALKVIRIPENLSLHDDVFSLGETLLNLRHPAIIPTIDVHLNDVPPYIVSAYVEGDTLQQRIQHYSSHAFPFDEAINIVRQIGQALSYLHHQGIIHRGVQPTSILLDSSAKALLTGFDLAITTDALKHRLLSQQLGTYYYMAPEQYRGTASTKSDQYALGCVAYELCTGCLPYKEPLHSENPQGRPKPPLAPRLLNHKLSDQAERAILRALSFSPGQRYDDVSAFVAALEPL